MRSLMEEWLAEFKKAIDLANEPCSPTKNLETEGDYLLNLAGYKNLWPMPESISKLSAKIENIK